MVEHRILQELLELLRRPEIPINVRTAIADELGNRQYLPAKNLLLQGLTDADSNMRSTCIRAVSFGLELREAAPTLIEILLNEEYEHVRIDAAYGLGTLRYKQALPSLKQVILDDALHMTLREAAYEAVLSILGKDTEEVPEIGKPTVIDWGLVHSL